jgi:hypothetical protein
MIKTFPKEFVVFAGLFVGPMAVDFAHGAEPASAAKNDPRLAVLENFFAKRHCPVRSLAGEFLIAADKNGLDWRLLPSISYVESGGGRLARNNNIFGWSSGRHRFSSVRESIHTVAAKLAHSKLYRNKDTDRILSTYNKRPRWAERVKAVMGSIGSPDLAAALAALN